MKIDLQKTIQESGLSGYAFAKLIGRHKNQVYAWLAGKHNITQLSQNHIVDCCAAACIQVFYKKDLTSQ